MASSLELLALCRDAVSQLGTGGGTGGAVNSVNGKTGFVVLTKADVGLGNADNTSDATKNAAVATLQNKTISGSSNTLTNIPQSAVTNLTTALSGKSPTLNDTGSGETVIANASTGQVKKLIAGTNVTLGVAGDNVTINSTAGGGGSTLECEVCEVIYDNTLGSTGNWTSVAIPSGYKRIGIKLFGRSSVAGLPDYAVMELNGDTTAGNYLVGHLTGVDAAYGTPSAESFNHNANWIGFVTASVSPANVFSIIDGTLYDPDGGKHKMAIFHNGMSFGTWMRNTMVTYEWENTAAVTSLTIKTLVGAGFLTDSRLVLVGVRDADVNIS